MYRKIFFAAVAIGWGKVEKLWQSGSDLYFKYWSRGYFPLTVDSILSYLYMQRFISSVLLLNAFCSLFSMKASFSKIQKSHILLPVLYLWHFLKSCHFKFTLSIFTPESYLFQVYHASWLCFLWLLILESVLHSYSLYLNVLSVEQVYVFITPSPVVMVTF